MKDKSTVLIEIQYMPSVLYMSFFAQFENVCLEQQEHYQKGSYRNRLELAGSSGKQMLSIPLQKGKNEKLPVRDVKIAYQEDWQQQHWRCIRSCYGNAPFYEHYEEGLYKFYQHPYTYLFDFNLEILHHLLDCLSISQTPKLSSTYQFAPSPDNLDLRNQISPKMTHSSTAAIAALRPYPQVFQEKSGFLPNLSIIDLLFCSGPVAIVYLKEINHLLNLSNE